MNHKLQPQTVKNIIEGWNLLYPYPKKDEQLAFISAKFFKKLHTVYSDEAFLIAADMVEDEATQFPTIAQIMKLSNVVADRIVREREMNTPALPEVTDNFTEEEVKRNLEKISIITDMLCGNITKEDAEKKQAKLVTYARTR